MRIVAANAGHQWRLGSSSISWPCKCAIASPPHPMFSISSQVRQRMKARARGVAEGLAASLR
jgi:hypothetical protein